jgi:two-component system LytT family response regulator
MLNCIIVEDEIKDALLIKKMCEKHLHAIEIKGVASTLDEAEELFLEVKPDLIFLDVELGNELGFYLLDRLMKYGINFSVIFTTAYDKYAVKAIKYSALDYILKPVKLDDLKQAIEKLHGLKNRELMVKRLELFVKNLSITDEAHKRIAIPVVDGYDLVNINELVYLIADGAYSVVYLFNRPEMRTTKNLKYFEEILPPEMFVRIHHKYIVNKNYVSSVKKIDYSWYVILNDGTQLEISQRRQKFVLDSFRN